MAIMDFFKTGQAAPAPAANSNPAAPNPTGTDPANAAPNPNAGNTGNNKQVNPLDEYKTLFDNASKNTPEAPPSFNLPDEGLSKVVSTMDFTKDVPKELMEKAMQGDFASIMEVINHSGRNAYKSALQHSTSLTDTFVTKRSEFDLKNVGSRVKSELTSQELSTTPNYQHPIVKAELTRVAQMFEKANPDASPVEIADAAKKYLSDMFTSMQPKQTEEEVRKASGEVDWSNYFNKNQ